MSEGAEIDSMPESLPTGGPMGDTTPSPAPRGQRQASLAHESRRALVSVSDKAGVDEFARGLSELGSLSDADRALTLKLRKLELPLSTCSGCMIAHEPSDETWKMWLDQRLQR